VRTAQVFIIQFFLLSVVAEAADAPVIVSISPEKPTVRFQDRMVLAVTFTNVSGAPRYLYRDPLRSLKLSVKASDGTILRYFPDPPITPPPPGIDSTDFFWLDAGGSIRFLLKLRLSQLGIKHPGTFRIVAFWDGTIATESKLESEDWDYAFSYSQPVEVYVAPDVR